MPIPTATYRIQVTPEFPLAEVVRIVDYLHALGVSHVYTSPLLEAVPGSQHGYDVVSHKHVGPAIGGEEGRVELVRTLRASDMGLIVDIVPNHMGVEVPEVNEQWWDVLRLGPQSIFAHWFDIDWSTGRIPLPVLGDPDGADPLDQLTIEDGELRYYEHRFPLAPGTEPAPTLAGSEMSARDVHDHQHYKLVSWRAADDRQRYRRFFAVTGLAGLRVELPDVFEATHREFARWVAAGECDGLRVDHPDGLADPGEYLARLRALAPDGWLTVEKITEPGEKLPTEWPVEGMTGYDALTEVNALLVDPSARQAFDALDAELGGGADWSEYVRTGKRMVATTILHSEVLRLSRMTPDVDQAEAAFTELLVAMPVYRSYLPIGQHYLDEAVKAALTARPDLEPTIDALMPRLTDPADPLCVRFQQTSGAVMAKGVEDTAYYRYTRLIALNEVGGDPGAFGATVADFHRAATEREADAPHGMTTLSTHDTKRSEDVRAAIAVLSEFPAEWAALVELLVAKAPVPNAAFGHLIWQTIVGVGGPDPAKRQRLHEYAEKAMREAADGTSWAHPDEEFEQAVHRSIDAVMDDHEVRTALATFWQQIAGYARSNSLSQKLIQLTMPGVPDTYQGSELWDDSLVDPDNRRPVDYALRRQLLAELDSSSTPPPIDESGRAKLWVVSQALRLRRRLGDAVSGYDPIVASGTATEHAVAYTRGPIVGVATRLPAGLDGRGGWGDTTIDLPSGGFTDVLSGRTWSGTVRLVELLADLPVALLERTTEPVEPEDVTTS